MKLDPLEKATERYFGVTDDLRETGYVLSDGTFLDLSGRHEAQGYVRKGDRFVAKRGDDYLARQRAVDHRQLPETVSDKLGKDSGSENMLAFMEKTGVLRVMPGVGFAVVRMPTVESIAAFMKGWKQAYGTDSAVVDILHLEGYTEDTQEITTPTVDKIVQFLDAHFNSPSMGASTQRLRFFSDCVNWPKDQVEDLNAMIHDGKEITRATFLKSVNPQEMKDLEEHLGYERDPRKGLTMAKDWHVAYYRSTVRGCPAVYFVWSAIEQVFTDLACIHPSASMGAAATYFYHVTTPLAWKQIQQDRGFRADDGVCGSGVYLWDSIDEAIMNQEDESSVIIRVEGKGPVSCEEALGRFPEEEGDQNYYEHVFVVPVKAGSIWRPRAMKLMGSVGLGGAPQKTFTIVEQSTKEVPWGLRDIPEDHAIFRSVERVIEGPSHHDELGVGDKMTVRIRSAGITGVYNIWRTA